MTLDDLIFEAETHRYSLRTTGEVLPSITTVIRAAGMYGYFPDDNGDAMAFGTEVHQLTEMFDRGHIEVGDIDPGPARECLSAYHKFREESGFVPVLDATEIPMFHPEYRYAGTPDRLGTMRGGVLVVLDLKTGPYRPAYSVQVGGQAELYRVWGFMRKFDNPRGVSLTLGRDGNYKAEAWANAYFGLTFFLSALGLYRWKQNHNIQ